MTHDYDPALDPYVEAILERKARHVVILDVRELSSVADIFVVASGSSHRQVTAIAEHVQQRLKKTGIKPLSVEGLKEGHWVLLDYGHVIIHLFYEPVREFYDLEGLWSDAPRVETSAQLKAQRKEEPEHG